MRIKLRSPVIFRQARPGLDEKGENGSGKLHPPIARLLFDTIQAGLAGKLPPSWPEPTGHRTTLRDDAEPQAVAALYKAAVAQGLVDDPRSTQTIAKLFGVSDRAPLQWCEKHPVTIAADAAGWVALSCAGLTIHHKPDGGPWLGDLLNRRLELAATAFRQSRGKTKKG